jgi:hypothetical protein
VLRLREEWLTCFARILLFVLDQLPHPFAIVTSFPLSAKRSNNAINLIELAPVLAEMFLEISMSFDFSMTREFDWIYTDLTKVRTNTLRCTNTDIPLDLTSLQPPQTYSPHLFSPRLTFSALSLSWTV